MDRSKLFPWMATVALALPLLQTGCADDDGRAEPRAVQSETRSPDAGAAERAPGAGAGAPTTAGPEHASEVELDDDPNDDLPAPEGSGGGETHGRRDYGGARGANTSPYDTPGANPSDIHN